MGGGCNPRCELGNIYRAPYFLELLFTAKFFSDSQQVDCLVGRCKIYYRLVYFLVLLLIETFRIQNINNLQDCLLFKHDSPKYCFLKIKGLWRNLTVI